MRRLLTSKLRILICGYLCILVLNIVVINTNLMITTKTPEKLVNSELETTKPCYVNKKTQTTFKWTIMVYMAADNDLEESGITDLYEMNNANFGSEICVVVEFDGWDSCLQQETDDLYYNTTQRIRILGNGGEFINLENQSEERNMGDPQTLSNFLTFSMTQFPAEAYCLILWNHGLGWETGFEEWTDYTTNNAQNTSKLPHWITSYLKTRRKNLCWDDRSFGDALTEIELQTALSEAPEAVNVLAFDACLMGCIEIAYAMRDFAQYMVASEDTLGLSGFYYYGFLVELGLRVSLGIPTNYDPKACARLIVEETIDNMQSHSELSMEIIQLGVIDLAKIQTLTDDLSDLADIMIEMENSQVKEICELLALYSEFGLSEQIDIGYVIDAVNTISYEAMIPIVSNLRNHLSEACMYQWANTSIITRSSGLTIYSPWDPELWVSNYSNMSVFARESGWDMVVSRMYAEADPYDYSDTVLSHSNPSITKRIEQNEIAIVFLSLHWKESITLRLNGPTSTDFDFYLFDFEFNLLDESYEEDYPETVSHTAYDGAEAYILVIHAYHGSGDFELKADYSTTGAQAQFLGCVNMFVSDSNDNSKIDKIQLILVFDSPGSETVTVQLQMLNHPNSFILKWDQDFIEGTEYTVLELPYEALYQQINSLLPTQRWECIAELSILEPTNWKYTFQITALPYLVKLADLDPPSNTSEIVTSGQIFEVQPLNPPRTLSSTSQGDGYELLLIMSVLGVGIVGGVGFWMMNRKTKSTHKPQTQYVASFRPTVTTDNIQHLAVCPSCGIVYKVQSATNICPTCQVELHSIVK